MARELSACLKLIALALLARLSGRDRLADEYGAWLRYRLQGMTEAR